MSRPTLLGEAAGRHDEAFLERSGSLDAS